MKAISTTGWKFRCKGGEYAHWFELCRRDSCSICDTATLATLTLRATAPFSSNGFITVASVSPARRTKPALPAPRS